MLSWNNGGSQGSFFNDTCTLGDVCLHARMHIMVLVPYVFSVYHVTLGEGVAMGTGLSPVSNPVEFHRT